ncbi:MAG: DUF493 family protein [Gammaproteobacteria bacterium]|jgi:putative lipoic acid-binding regulatory protein|nr:DUF493 family protein [Gammaproteobacteria bacterium]
MSEDDSPLEFPCRWPVKAMVEAGDDSLHDVLAVIQRHAELPGEHDVRVRPSRHGRYESITVVIEAESRRHLEIIYTEIRALDAVKMTL